MSIGDIFTGPYLWGIIAVGALWGTSFVITNRNPNPFALACGVDNNYSASLLQFLIFTYLTVFAYVAVYAARFNSNVTPLPNIPLNLLVLMGISVTSATASKGIVVSYSGQGKLPAGSDDKGGVVRDKDGSIALTKVQMLIWTLIAAGIYLATVMNFIDKGLYALPNQTALPDVDGALLVLMGAAHGGYIGGKLVSQNTSGPIIVRILPSPLSVAAGRVSIVGGLFGASPDGNMVFYQNIGTGAQNIVPTIPAAQWSDSVITFDLPPDMQTPGKYTIWVSAQGQTSAGYNIEIKP